MGTPAPPVVGPLMPRCEAFSSPIMSDITRRRSSGLRLAFDVRRHARGQRVPVDAVHAWRRRSCCARYERAWSNAARFSASKTTSVSAAAATVRACRDSTVSAAMRPPSRYHSSRESGDHCSAVLAPGDDVTSARSLLIARQFVERPGVDLLLATRLAGERQRATVGTDGEGPDVECLRWAPRSPASGCRRTRCPLGGTARAGADRRAPSRRRRARGAVARRAVPSRGGGAAVGPKRSRY